MSVSFLFKCGRLLYGRLMSRRQSSALFAAFGLLFQLLIAGFHIPPALALAGLESDPASWHGPRTIVICTMNGLQKITLDDRNKPVDGKSPAPSGGNNCPLCQSLSSTALLVVVNTLPPRPRIQSVGHQTLSDLQLGDFSPLTSFPRGPPIV